MGCNSGMVSSPTSMIGGWKVCTMDSGRPELLRLRPLGLSTGEVGDEEDWTGGCIGGFLGSASLGGDAFGVLCPENWDINEKTGDYAQVISIDREGRAAMKLRQGGGGRSVRSKMTMWNVYSDRENS